MSLQLPEASSDAAAAPAIGFEPSTGVSPEGGGSDVAVELPPPPPPPTPAGEAVGFEPSTGGRPEGNESDAAIGLVYPDTTEEIGLDEVLEVLEFDESRGSRPMSPRREPPPDLECGSAGPLGFGHVGVVPPTPAASATSFYNAVSGKITQTPDLENKLKDLLGLQGTKNQYTDLINAGHLAVSLVDLSQNKLEPRYAGVNDGMNFYAASVAKVSGLLAAYQLKANANAFLEKNPRIASGEALARALKKCWSMHGIPPQDHPDVTKILEFIPGKPILGFIPGKPPRVDLQKSLTDRFDSISDSNENGSIPIELLGYRFVGSTMLAHGLFSEATGRGLWVNKDYNPNHPNSWTSSPYMKLDWHSVNAVSIAQFFTLAAQGRMIDGATSTAILEHLEKGRCAPLVDLDTLKAKGLIAAKCGFIPLKQPWEILHIPLYYKDRKTKREFVAVILTRNWNYKVVKDLFNDLITPPKGPLRD